MDNTQAVFSANETNQGVVRFVNTLAIFIYLLICSFFETGDIFTDYIIPSVIYLIITYPLYYWSVRCLTLSDVSFERISYRIVGLTGDIVFLSIVMILANEVGTPLFFVYLWIIVGNGIRYGINYLMVATIISIVCFSSVVYLAPAWQSTQLFPIAIGLLISLIILPYYILSLIARLFQALESEKAAHQLKRSFLANVNHELRTPLNSILSLSEIIRTYKLPDRVHGMIGMISTSANTQLQIINSILDISKIEAGEFYLNKNIFKLPSLVHEVQQIILPQALNKNIDFDVYIEAECSQVLEGASDQIKQILVNLLGNAVKFTESGFVNLSVYSTYSSDKEQGIIFEIRDTGIGIAHEAQEKIFKPFVQGDSSITRKYGGTGLGIAISSELSKLMGGTLTLDSEENKGTKFLFKLSLDKPILADNNLYGNFKILTYFINDEHQHIIKFYKQQGFDIAGIENVTGKDLEILLNNQAIMIVDGIDYDKLPESIRRFIADYRVPIMAISDSLEINRGNLKPVTSIRSDPSSDILLNAISVCFEFLNIDDEKKITIPESRKYLNILIAEDDPILGEINRVLFSNLNHKVDIISDGIEALAALESDEYDIAILDLHMPGMSGLDVAKQYKSSAKNREIPIILLTADTYMAQTGENDLSIFTRVLVKPISPIKLLSTIYDNLSLNEELALLNDFCNIKGFNHTVTVERDTVLNHKIINNIIAITEIKTLQNILRIYDKETKILLNRIVRLKVNNDKLEINNIFHRLKGTSNAIGISLFSTCIDCNLEKHHINDIDFIRFIEKLKAMHNEALITYEKYLSEYIKD